MCPCRAKKLMILSHSEYLVILTPQRYRRTSTTVSSSSVRGGGTPRRRVPPLRTCHHTTPHVRGPGATLRWHCYPLVPPSRLTMERLTTRSSPLTSHGRSLTSGPLHPVVSGQHRGTPGSNIRAKPTATSTPCRPDASVSPLQVPAAATSVRGGGTPRRRVLGVCNRLNTSRFVRGRLCKI